jgi:hypothetical protein
LTATVGTPSLAAAPSVAAPQLPNGFKAVASESAPVISAVTVAGTLADSWQLLVEHLGWWVLPNSLFVGLGAGLFFFFRNISKAAHLRAVRRREARDRRYLIELVRAGVTIPIPPGSPVVELPSPPAPPAMPAGG